MQLLNIVLIKVKNGKGFCYFAYIKGGVKDQSTPIHFDDKEYEWNR